MSTRDMLDWLFIEDEEFKYGSVEKAIVFAGVAIATQLRDLGTVASKCMVDVEALGAAIRISNEEIAAGLREVATAIRDRA